MRKLLSSSFQLFAAFGFALLALGGCETGRVPVVTQAAGAGPAAASGAIRTDEAPVIPAALMTEAYARMVARNTYFWAWPMVNAYNRRLAFTRAPAPVLVGGIMPIAPLNRLAMLTGYVDPAERLVACPNQDVVYGAGVAALDESPVVIQVPDFGKRFWVYQIVDLRTDSVANLGSMYGTKPGFYLLAGPDWHGAVPEGIAQVIRSGTRTAFVVPRVFQADTPQDNAAIQPLLNRIDMYPLAMFDGVFKQHDWKKLPAFPMPAHEGASPGEARWVFPERFFDGLPAVLADAPPMPGEEARYSEALAVIAAARRNPSLKAAMIDEAARADKDLVDPLLQFRNFGIPLAHHWTTQRNGGRFGTDYLTRTAVARSNIFVNKPEEATYFYLDLDAAGERLNAHNRYAITFAKGQWPPVQGFWSLTLYDAYHFFVPNPLGRYAIGTRNTDLRPNPDGSLTVYIQSEPPADPAQRANWLPAPRDGDFSLMMRAYWPAAAITAGNWTPPAAQRIQ
ncbi:hypothetical protein B0G81_3325 [Paraburkholderia sp. BL6665CI2N2]|uniref:DUF1254 domain-containing protein n=1 Tax=Paraburkholderia sp. BL6665CI2N2 TaxID=1938806 RepID=UPI0010F389D6|nr:DUF1214 domain-containing protein [Paraburkholderia sp. BL6665CI2N2]TDY23001.1 hypothetical protein B0G81_3325 [Paraburkholderia sp. BL6665CI2N2]